MHTNYPVTLDKYGDDDDDDNDGDISLRRSTLL